MSDGAMAFVLMPFDPEFEPIYRRIVTPALERAGYEVRRADDFLDRHNILRDIVESIAGARLVVADITARNPNVLYELGVAHGLGIPTVMIAQSISEVPFDLRSYRVEVYDTHFAKMEDFQKRLGDVAREHLQGKISFGSPVTDFYPEPRSRQSHSLVISRSPAVGLSGSGSEENKKELLDFILERDEALATFLKLLGEIGAATEQMGSAMQSHTARLDEINANVGRPGAASEAHAIINSAAGRMNAYADEVERGVAGIRGSINEIDASMAGWHRCYSELKREGRTAQESPEELSAAEESVRNLRAALDSSRKSMSQFRESVRTIPPLTREARSAGQRVLKAIDGLLEIMSSTEALWDRIMRMIREAAASE